MYTQYPNYNYNSVNSLSQSSALGQMMQPVSTPGSLTIQNGGSISVRCEEEARNYQVARGTSVTFIDENAPYLYTKTMGFSQLDRPQFEKYRLVKEEVAEELAQQTAQKAESQAKIEELEKELEELKTQLDTLQSIVDKLSSKKATGRASTKKETDNE